MALIYSSALNKRINLKSGKSRCQSVEVSSLIQQQLHHHNEKVVQPPIAAVVHHYKQRSNEENHVDNSKHAGRDSIDGSNGSPTRNKRGICSLCGKEISVSGSPSPNGLECTCSARESSNGIRAKRSASSKSHKNLQRCKASDARRKITVTGAPTSVSSNVASQKEQPAEELPNVRKISTPIMMVQSMYSETPSKSGGSLHMRKTLAKKRLNQQIALDAATTDNAATTSYIFLPDSKESEMSRQDALTKCLRIHRSFYRRRSISLDAAVNGMTTDGEYTTSCESSPDSSMDSAHDSPVARMNAFQRMKCRFNKWKLST